MPKKPLTAGDEGEDRKARRQEIIKVKTMIAKLYDRQGDKMLKRPKKELPTSVPTLQGGRPESNRRKF